ncbi:hypothetical protein AYO38_08290 [bacterium SCGC AG-212-C10]|nr:hypothetical protein AYO38_08290 [bacterium SCGC AG-212-C10]
MEAEIDPKVLAKLTVAELVELHLAVDVPDIAGYFGAMLRKPARQRVPVAERLGRSADPAHRAFAAPVAAAGSEDSRLVERVDSLLKRLLKDEDSSVRAASLHQGFQFLHMHRSADALGERLRAGSGEATRPRFVEPLTPRVDMTPFERASRDPDPEVRMSVAMSLTWAASEEVNAILIRLADDPDENVRSSVSFALLHRDVVGGVTPEVLELLWRLSDDPDLDTRVDGLATLVALGEPEAARRAIRILEDAVERNRSSRCPLYPLTTLISAHWRERIDGRAGFIPDDLWSRLDAAWNVSRSYPVRPADERTVNG